MLIARRFGETCLALTLAGASGAFGQASGNGDLAKLSLEQLLNAEVISATKSKGFSLRRTPGIVRVFTRADIERYGFRTLKDVLFNVPGLQIQEYRAGHQSVFSRGIRSRYNNKILWLIDGIPLRDGYYGHNNIDEAFPLRMVERIEIINGPGGVLHGANAFTGVVSITTKKVGRSLGFTAGSLDQLGGSAEFGQSGVYAYADYLGTEGFHPRLNSDGRSWDHPQDRTRSYGLLKINRKGFQGIFSSSRNWYADTYRTSSRNQFWQRKPTYGASRAGHTLRTSSKPLDRFLTVGVL